MGLRKHCGCRRSQVSDCSTFAMPRCAASHVQHGMPRCGPACPLKGHLSTKSNAFCIDSSRNLNNQYLIRDHMVVHYNRILSAKAAVDCSVPKSRLSCIKLADQQRREKLKKKTTRCKEKVCETTCQTCSRRLLPSSFRKTFTEVEDSLFPSAEYTQCLLRSPPPCCGHCSVCCTPIKDTRKCSRNTSGASYSNSSLCVSVPPNKHSGISRSRSTESFVSVSFSQKCRGNHARASSGDLLERHSECFTKSRKPFTPRTLKSDAKSFLSEYRYYTPAGRKKKCCHKQCVEVQTQTDTISFPCAEKVYVRKVTSEQQKITSKAEDECCTLDEPERVMDGFKTSIIRETSRCSQKSSSRTTFDAEEEELLYLTFIEDVTNEILRLGVFSNRVLDKLFECHIEENKNRLDEGKMRQMLDVLKSDLGCGQDSETELICAGQNASDSLDLEESDTTEELPFTSKGCRLRKAAKSEEFLETVDLSSKEQNRCSSLSWSKVSRETQSREDSSEDTTENTDAGTECDYCSEEFEEHPDTSSTCEGALDSIACDSDSEANKELDDLEENFADALQV